MTLPVEGMTCASCAAAIERGLKMMPGVKDAGVNFAIGKVKVDYDSQESKPAEFIDKINGLGYKAVLSVWDAKVGGMTCGACSAAVERGLKKVPGVITASVNFAMETAHAEYIPGLVTAEDLNAAVVKAGYKVLEQAEATPEKEEAVKDEELGRIKLRLIVSVVLGALIMFSSLHGIIELPVPHDIMNYILLALATPVQFWAGWRFYRGAYASLIPR